MKTHISNRCIGGPLDGKCVDIDAKHDSFRVPLRMPIELATSDPLPDVSTTTVEYVAYNRIRFHSGGGDVAFWAIDGLSPLDVFKRLLHHYTAPPVEIERNDIDRAQNIVAQIEPLLAAQGNHVQSMVLADLTATWAAAHNPAIRNDVLFAHIQLINDLIPENEKEIFGGLGFPTKGLS